MAVWRGDTGDGVGSCIRVHRATALAVVIQVSMTMEPIMASPGTGVVEMIGDEWK